MPSRARRQILQSARHLRAMNQGRQERRKVDTTVVLLVRRQCRPPSASCTRLQPRQLHADAGIARGCRALVADLSPGEPREDRCQDRRAFPLRHIPDGRGRGATGHVCGDSAADSSTSSAAISGLRSAVAAARINQREKCALITENRGSGELRSPHSEGFGSKSRKIPPEVATCEPEAYRGARNWGSLT